MSIKEGPNTDVQPKLDKTIFQKMKIIPKGLGGISDKTVGSVSKTCSKGA